MLRILEIYCYSKLATALRRSLTICDVFWPQASQSRKFKGLSIASERKLSR